MDNGGSCSSSTGSSTSGGSGVNKGAGTSKASGGMSSSTRLQRNQAEKQRRDRLNGYISELANLVPMVRNASKPLDKVSILRLAAAQMRLNLSCLNPKRYKGKIVTLPSSMTSYLEVIEKTVGGFIIVTTFSGMIVFCSKCIEDFVGYQNIDVMGNSIYNYIHSSDLPHFERKMNAIINRHIQKKESSKKSKMIKAHMQQRPLPRTNDIRFRKMIFKLSVYVNDPNGINGSAASSGKAKKPGRLKDFGSSAVVLMFIEPVKPEPEIDITYIEAHQDAYFTIHGLQAEIIYADQRISTITGYMPHEVQGSSAYQYICSSDVPIALFAQKAMFTSNDGTGLITYRLRIRDLRYIYLQTRGQIAYKDSTKQVSHFVCFNKLLSDEEGSRELKKFQQRFAPQLAKATLAAKSVLAAQERPPECQQAASAADPPFPGLADKLTSSSVTSPNPSLIVDNHVSPIPSTSNWDPTSKTKIVRKISPTKALPAVNAEGAHFLNGLSNNNATSVKCVEINGNYLASRSPIIKSESSVQSVIQPKSSAISPVVVEQNADTSFFSVGTNQPTAQAHMTGQTTALSALSNADLSHNASSNHTLYEFNLPQTSNVNMNMTPAGLLDKSLQKNGISTYEYSLDCPPQNGVTPELSLAEQPMMIVNDEFVQQNIHPYLKVPVNFEPDPCGSNENYDLPAHGHSKDLLRYAQNHVTHVPQQMLDSGGLDFGQALNFQGVGASGIDQAIDFGADETSELLSPDELSALSELLEPSKVTKQNGLVSEVPGAVHSAYAIGEKLCNGTNSNGIRGANGKTVGGSASYCNVLPYANGLMMNQNVFTNCTNLPHGIAQKSFHRSNGATTIINTSVCGSFQTSPDSFNKLGHSPSVGHFDVKQTKRKKLDTSVGFSSVMRPDLSSYQRLDTPSAQNVMNVLPDRRVEGENFQGLGIADDVDISAINSSLNKELYYELDMFFQNLPPAAALNGNVSSEFQLSGCGYPQGHASGTKNSFQRLES